MVKELLRTFSTWNAFSGCAKHCGINFRGWHLNKVSSKIYFYNKTKLKAKKLGHLDEKTAKNGHLYVQFSQKLLFKVKKSFTKRSAWSKKLLSLSENLFTKTSFLTFAFRSKCRVNESTSCKKNIARRIPEATRSIKSSQKTLKAAKAISFYINSLTHYLLRSDLTIDEN